jgi:predicted alpha/beta-fold hydrolase
LEQLLKEEVFGQHIAADVVYRTVKGYLSNPSPSKPLVLSFHGWTGNGKNHMAYVIARSLYKNELKTVHYHHFMAVTTMINSFTPVTTLPKMSSFYYYLDSALSSPGGLKIVPGSSARMG